MKRELKPGTVLIPCPAVIVSVGDETESNLITLSWVANLCSNPPRMGIGVVPKRHSYGLLKRIGDFVINVPSKNQIEGTVICGTRSGRDIDKFEATGFTPKPSTQITSPMISECPLNIECRTWKIIEVGSHHLFIADVVAAHIDEKVLNKDGTPDLTKMGLFTYNPLVGQYWIVNEYLRDR